MNKQDNQRQAVSLEYLAGIIDGEGTISIFENKVKGQTWNVRHNAAIGLGLTDRPVVQMFADRFGGNVREERVPNRKLMYRWYAVGNKRAPEVIKHFLPYLHIKKRQAEIVMEFIKGYKNTLKGKTKAIPKEELLRRQDFRRQIKELNS